MKDRQQFLKKFNIASLEYPAILSDFPPPLVQDGIWVWGVGKPSPGGRNGQEPGARSGPCGEASGPENRLMIAETQTCWLAFGARCWPSSPGAIVQPFPFLSKRLWPLVPPTLHCTPCPCAGPPCPVGASQASQSSAKDPPAAAPSCSNTEPCPDTRGCSERLCVSPALSSPFFLQGSSGRFFSRDMSAMSGPSGPGLSSGNTLDSSLHGGGGL